MVEVKLKRVGCLDVFGCVFSLGLLPIMLFFHVQSIPRTLTEEEMVLANGTSIPWRSISQAKVTKIYYNNKRTYIGSRFELKYGNGAKLKFGTGRVANEAEVTEFIMAHLPPGSVR